MYLPDKPDYQLKLATLLLTQFQLDEVISISSIPSGALSYSWDTLVMLNGNRRRWCIKRHRGKSKQRLDFESAFVSALQRNGLRLIPNLVLTASGESWFDLSADRLSAFEYIASDKPVDWLESHCSLAQCQSAGAALADFHVHSVLTLPELRPFAPEYKPIITTQPLLVLMQDLRHLQDSATNDPVISEIRKQSSALSNNIGEVARRVSAHTDQPSLLIHGDFHPGNVLLRGNRAVAVIDYDYVRLGSPVFDVAYGALLFSGAFSQPLPVVLESAQVAAFLRGYGQSATLGADLEDYLAYSQLLVAQWLLDAYRLNALTRPLLKDILLQCFRSVAKLSGAL